MKKDEPYTLWWRHHSLSASLISDENRMFTLITWVFLIRFFFMKLNRIDHSLVEMNPIHYDDVITVFLLHWFRTKSHVYTYNLSISHPFLMRLKRIDHTLIEMTPIRYDVVITVSPLHWFRTRIACLHLIIFHPDWLNW